MADSTWHRTHTLSPGGDLIPLAARVEYPVAGTQAERRRLTRDVLEVRDPETAKGLVVRWGFPGLEDAFSAEPLRVVADKAVAWAEIRGAAIGSDISAREWAEDQLMVSVHSMEIGFAPGDGLVPQLVPTNLWQLVAVALLEELRNVGPSLQCHNFPAPGCLRDVPPRQGDRGRYPKYCSERCALRAQSRRAYMKRKGAERNG